MKTPSGGPIATTEVPLHAPRARSRDAADTDCFAPLLGRWFDEILRPIHRRLAIALVCLAAGPAMLGQSPRVDAVNPAQGPIAGGAVVTITGANFQGAMLTVDKMPVTAVATSTTEIRFTSPPHDNGIATIKLTTGQGAAYGEFLYVPPKLEDLPAGYITTVAGVGRYTAFYRPATQAEMQAQGSPAFDRLGNIYIQEPNNNRVVRVRSDGILEPFAGSGNDFGHTATGLGEGGPATEAVITFPRGVALDANGDAYISDLSGRLWRVDGRTGIITTIAGTGTPGFSGDGGPAARAQLYDATHLVGDGNGTIFFIDYDDTAGFARIRKVTPDGIISTIAGIGPAGFSGDGGPATQAQFDLVTADHGALALDPQGNLFVADEGNDRIRRIDGHTGVITTVVGPADVRSVACDLAGNIYYIGNFRIIEMSPAGQTLATYGNGIFPGLTEDGASATAAFIHASDVAVDSLGNIVYVDMDVRSVRRINVVTGRLETVAGSTAACIGENGRAIATTLGNYNGDIAFLPTGKLLVTDDTHGLIRKIDADGLISTVGRGGTLFSTRQGWADIQSSIGIEADPAGQMLVTSAWSINRVDLSRVGHRVAGAVGSYGYAGDGGPVAEALLCQPWDTALDAAGNLFIADTNNNRIRRIDAQTGVITTVAGSGPTNGYEHYEANGRGGFSGDGGPALLAQLNTPYGVAVDSGGNLFIADRGNGRIRKVDANGTITTFAASMATKLTFDGSGRLYAACDDAVFRYDAAGKVLKIAGRGLPGFSGDGGPALDATTRASAQATGLAIDAEGNVFFVDSGNYRIRAIRSGALLEPPAITRQPVNLRVTEGQQATFAVAATGLPAPTYQWQKDGSSIAGATNASYTLSSAQASDQGARFAVVVTNLMGSVTSDAAVLTVVGEPMPPSIAAPPMSQTVAAGGTVTFTILANGIAPLSYQWRKDGVNLVVTEATLTLANVEASDAGSYTVVVSNSAGSVISPPATLTVTAGSHLVNISTRAYDGTGNSVTIGGFVIGGGAPKRLLLRAVGPTLTTQGIGSSEVLLDPTIEVHDALHHNAVIATIDNWSDNIDAAETAATAAELGAAALAPGDAKSSAVILALRPGVYSFIAKGRADTSGIVLVEVYDADSMATGSTVVNISTRAYCATGNGVAIGGFVVTGNAPKHLLLRAVGPTLTTQGIGMTEVLLDPTIEVHDALHDNAVIASNDNWGDNPNAADLVATGARVGATPLANGDTESAALLVTLQPGVYSFIARGKSGAPSGIVLIEVYDAD